MSEFSETYNLLSSEQQHGVALLEAAQIEGFVFEPANGWVTILPRSEFGQPLPVLIKANNGVLLEYLYDEDSGWQFALFEGSNVVSAYSCVWLDETDWGDDSIRIDDGALNLDRVVEIVSRIKQVSRDEVERILYPKVVQQTTPEGATYATFAQWTGLDEHPAFAFAELIGLKQFRWMRWREEPPPLQASTIHVRPDI